MTSVAHSIIPVSDIGAQSTTRTLGALLGLAHSTRGKSHREDEHFTFPLVKVVVRTQIIADCAVTELEEHYANPHAKPMDVTHIIPLPADGAVIAFEMIAGSRRAKGLCKKAADAQRDFKDAKKRGKTAAIVESVRDDEHVIRLANVPAKTEVIVKLRVVERLRVDDGRFEFRFPTTMSEKFDPYADNDLEDAETSTDAPKPTGRDHPIRLEGGTELDCEITLAPGATDITSSLALTRSDDADGTIRLRPSAGATCNRDIVVRSWARGSDAVTRAYTDGDRTLVVIDPPAKRKPELERAREAVFVLDRSGSMAGSRLGAAKRALATALRSLAPRDRFEIIAFNSELMPFAKEAEGAIETNIARALHWLDAVNASGGTLAMPALMKACRGRVATDCVRTVLFLTDGDVANDEEIIALTRSFDPATRLFVIGIGMAPSNALISRLARLGGGTHAFIQDEDDIEAEIARFDAALAGPMACGLGEDGARRHSGRDLFAGRAAVFFVEGAREHVKVSSVDGRFHGECVVSKTTMPLGALWARDRVAQLEDRIVSHESERSLIEPEIEMLGVTHQIQTRLTSFVAIDEASQVHGEPLEFVQPMDHVGDQTMACYSQQDASVVCHELGSPMHDDGIARYSDDTYACHAPIEQKVHPRGMLRRSSSRSAPINGEKLSLTQLLARILTAVESQSRLTVVEIGVLSTALRAYASDPRVVAFITAFKANDRVAILALGLAIAGVTTLDELLAQAASEALE